MVSLEGAKVYLATFSHCLAISYLCGKLWESHRNKNIRHLKQVRERSQNLWWSHV